MSGPASLRLAISTRLRPARPLAPGTPRSNVRAGGSAPGHRARALGDGLDEQGLHGAADRPPLVVKAGLGEADAVRLDPRPRLEAHPLPERMPVERDRDVGVDAG